MKSPTVLTLGHSNLPLGEFMDLLRQNLVSAVVDVRSAPYSRYTYEYNREPLAEVLRSLKVDYEFLGAKLGARPRDPACYKEGRVHYGALAGTALFKSGIECVIRIATTRRVALMCAEKEPLECHRSILIARVLRSMNLPVDHIHADGSLETHEDALARLLELHDLSQPSLFWSEEERIEQAYTLQERRIAFVDEAVGAKEEF